MQHKRFSIFLLLIFTQILPSQPYVNLKSNDGKITAFPRQLIKYSETLSNMIKDDNTNEDEQIPIPYDVKTINLCKMLLNSKIEERFYKKDTVKEIIDLLNFLNIKNSFFLTKSAHPRQRRWLDGQGHLKGGKYYLTTIKIYHNHQHLLAREYTS